jgi:hypothetical protein
VEERRGKKGKMRRRTREEGGKRGEEKRERRGEEVFLD